MPYSFKKQIQKTSVRNSHSQVHWIKCYLKNVIQILGKHLLAEVILVKFRVERFQLY